MESEASCNFLEELKSFVVVKIFWSAYQLYTKVCVQRIQQKKVSMKEPFPHLFSNISERLINGTLSRGVANKLQRTLYTMSNFHFRVWCYCALLQDNCQDFYYLSPKSSIQWYREVWNVVFYNLTSCPI